MKMMLAAILAAAWLCPRDAAPDTCTPTAMPGISRDEKIRVIPATDWTFAWQRKNDKGDFELVQKGKLTQVGHPHLHAYVSNSGVFIIFNPSGGHELENRIVFYRPDGKVIKTVGLGYVLTKDEIDGIQHTISHMLKVVAQDQKGLPKAGITEKQDHFRLTTALVREVRLEVETGNLVPEEKK